MIFNMIAMGASSGGGGDVYAFITVTYPAGSVCTATNGSITLTASNTSGYYVFKIPTPATTPENWTVACTDGTDSDSTSVSISQEGQSAPVVLIYRFYIVKAGVEQITLTPTGGTVYPFTGYMQWGGDVQVVALLKAQVDLTNYAKMYVVVNNGKSWYGGQTPALGSSATNPVINSNSGVVTPHNQVTMLQNSAQGDIPAGTYEVDVSSYTGVQYVWLSMAYYGNVKPYIQLTDWYLK